MYVFVLFVFLLGDVVGWDLAFLWPYHQAVFYQYLMAFCTLLLTVTSSHFARVDAMNNMVALKEMFMRYISHELRTPLSTVFMGLQIARSELDRTGQQTQLLETVADAQHSCQISIDILNDMLLYDRIVNGYMVLEERNLDPADVVKKTLRPFRVEVSFLL